MSRFFLTQRPPRRRGVRREEMEGEGKSVKSGESSYSRFVKDAVFMITNPALLDKVISMLDEIPMQDRDTKGDLYEYLLSKLTTAGRNGQFRTPRHIIKMMVELTRTCV